MAFQRRLTAELEKMSSIKSEEKPEEDADLAVIQSEIALLQLNALREFVKEEEKETQLRHCDWVVGTSIVSMSASRQKCRFLY